MLEIRFQHFYARKYFLRAHTISRNSKKMDLVKFCTNFLPMLMNCNYLQVQEYHPFLMWQIYSHTLQIWKRIVRHSRCGTPKKKVVHGQDKFLQLRHSKSNEFSTHKWQGRLVERSTYSTSSSGRTALLRTTHGLMEDIYNVQGILSRSSWTGAMNFYYPRSLMQEHLAEGIMAGVFGLS